MAELFCLTAEAEGIQLHFFREVKEVSPLASVRQDVGRDELQARPGERAFAAAAAFFGENRRRKAPIGIQFAVVGKDVDRHHRVDAAPAFKRQRKVAIAEGVIGVGVGQAMFQIESARRYGSKIRQSILLGRQALRHGDDNNPQ